MPRVREQVLNCPTCGRGAELPKCHGRTMEDDGSVFFCPTCAKELDPPSCCGGPMRLGAKVRDIRREMFQKL